MRRSDRWSVLRSAILSIGLVVLCLPLHAQVDTGSIVGTVTDQSGAVVASANVKLSSQATGATLTTTTSGDGVYKFSPVRIGVYSLEATAQGFQTVTQKEVTVNIGSNLTLNFNLKPGSQTETIEVTTATPVLQTEDASVGQVVEQRNINDLPLNGRNFTFLAQLAQGVNTPQSDTRGNAASGAFSANGFRPSQNNYMLDGIDNNSDTVDFLNGTNYVSLPPVDAIQEFKVQTTGFSAEHGRAGGAVLNAVMKSGTNQFHGSAWEFFRNDKLDARDFFEHNCTAGVCTATPKAELRWNQFGGAVGGPVIRNKVFFFGDTQFWRLRQGQQQTVSVPTMAERNSGYTNLQDLITGQGGTVVDALGRSFPTGTVFDPATTRSVGANFVRDPFGLSTCSTPLTGGTLATCPGLNIIPANRLDPNAIKLLNLYPNPTNGNLFQNFATAPKFIQNERQFDVRLDLNLTQKDLLYYSFSGDDNPKLFPGPFGGVLDGGGFTSGLQTALSQHNALIWNHTFSPNTINVARVGLNYLHTTRNTPTANDLNGQGGNGIPADFGIVGVPQSKENGGLPAFGIGGLATIGGASFLPSDEVSSTIQMTDDFTKIYGKHTFKMGFEQQHVKFSTLQPPWSRGQFNFAGQYTDTGISNTGNTGRAQILLTPVASTVGGVDYSGGPNTVFVSNSAQTDDGKNYWGSYLQDDWKVSSKLTLNLGLRWDYFSLTYEHHGAQANFVPFGPPTGSPLLIAQPTSLSSNLTNGSTTCTPTSTNFACVAALDGIGVDVTKKYGGSLGNAPKTNFAPRLGFAYQVTPKLVARGGFGMFYNGFENIGYGPNLGVNFPYVFSFSFFSPNNGQPITYSSCPPGSGATAGNSATLESGFGCIPLNPALVNANGLQLRGIQFDYKTPYSMGSNFTLQYQLTPTMSVEAAYVGTYARHLTTFTNRSNNVSQILPVSANPSAPGNIPFPHFARGSNYLETVGNSYYHGLQTKLEKRFSGGLDFLATYTYSKVRSDAIDNLNNAGNPGYRAPSVPGFGPHADYALAGFDIRNVVHLSGGYQLPFGKGKRFMGNASGFSNAALGGWTIQSIVTLQGGQPFEIPCPTATAAGVNCTSLVLPGKNPRTSIHLNPDGTVGMLNASAFYQPCPVGAPAFTGCLPLTGTGVLGGNQPTQIAGPGFHRWDFSLFKNFPITERTRLEFRSEFFNILNHPNFNYPGFAGFGNAIPGATNFLNGGANFGKIGSTRDNPLDPREIQFALKLYF